MSHQRIFRNKSLKPAMTACVALLIVAVAAWTATADDDAAGSLRAGAAASNITPPLGEMIVGGWKPIPAKNIHDELHARCLVLDDGDTKLAIVLCDNVGIPREVFDAAKKKAAEATGIPADHILTAATHTHSATTARGPNKVVREKEMTAYQTFLVQRIADGIVRAAHNLEPAEIGFGTAEEPSQVFNRRWHMTPGSPALKNPFGGVDKVRMNPPRRDPNLLRPAGPTDPQIAFLSVRSVEGRPIALLANYSLHYVGGVRSGDVSADYFGVFAGRIEELLGAGNVEPRFVGILSNGTSGDVNNIDFQGQRKRREPYEQINRVADLVAKGVYEAHKSVEFRRDVQLEALTRELTLSVRKPTPEQMEWARAQLESGEEGKSVDKAKIYARRFERLDKSPDEISVLLQTLQIGDVGIAAIPFETFTETGLDIKKRSPCRRTFTIELANGSYGYLPTPEQHKLGGYETWMGTNNVEKEASEKIVQSLLEMFCEMDPAATTK